MNTKRIIRLLLAIVLAAGGGLAVAQERPPAARHNGGPSGQGVLRLLPADAVTEHSVDTAQGKLAYQATAGTLSFFNQSGEKSADVFYTAYVAKNLPIRTAAPAGR